jgi:hypothetical protein
MSKKPISPLRRRLIDDMTARRFSEDTKKDYSPASLKLWCFSESLSPRERRWR